MNTSQPFDRGMCSLRLPLRFLARSIPRTLAPFGASAFQAPISCSRRVVVSVARSLCLLKCNVEFRISCLRKGREANMLRSFLWNTLDNGTSLGAILLSKLLSTTRLARCCQQRRHDDNGESTRTSSPCDVGDQQKSLCKPPSLLTDAD